MDGGWRSKQRSWQVSDGVWGGNGQRSAVDATEHTVRVETGVQQAAPPVPPVQCVWLCLWRHASGHVGRRCGVSAARRGGGGGIKAEQVWRLVLPSVRTGLGFAEQIVCSACLKPRGKLSVRR